MHIVYYDCPAQLPAVFVDQEGSNIAICITTLELAKPLNVVSRQYQLSTGANGSAKHKNKRCCNVSSNTKSVY